MASAVESTLAFLHILLITPKSESYVPLIVTFTYIATRVLLASIRNLRKCLCPRCTVDTSQVDQVGTKRDDTRRVNQARDSTSLRYRVRVEKARDAIYKAGQGLKSKAVETFLAPESMVPTRVRSNTLLSVPTH